MVIFRDGGFLITLLTPTKTLHGTSGTFVYYEAQIALIFHPIFKKWMPPGGHIEENESPQQAAIRETLEETGLDVTLINPTALTFNHPNAKTVASPICCALENIPQSNKAAAHQHIDFIFLATPKLATTFSSKENLTPKWYTQKQIHALPEMLIFKETREIIDYIFNTLVGTVL
ncbi:nucleoside triphosphate hydrolase [Candidatus Aerophobetes bacterium]|uniref:Nucleoside triphosphate hydrolase n=1 Tax=Aerophobetes bacterium TaxID=2030807 RepID=A0A2A4X7T1_UNCAE|nr:MAG: nucleoside triphosphate hydrolase [Candidatus Aerophobetes bacterium]